VANPTPTPTPTPANTLPPGMTCNPTPPPLYGIKVGVFDNSSSRVILDSKPLVVNVDGYCERVGTGGSTQKFCDTRLEGTAERYACDYLAVGKSAQTGRWGPTWTWNGKPCDGDNFTSCANHQENQFMAIAKTTGHFEACAAPDVPVSPRVALRGEGHQVRLQRPHSFQTRTWAGGRGFLPSRTRASRGTGNATGSLP